MRNIDPYPDSCLDFHKKVLKSKHKTNEDPNYKDRITALEGRVGRDFVIYDTLFNDNRLESIAAVTYTAQEKADLHKLYKYGSSPIKKLKEKLTTTDSGRAISTCLNCTINDINSFDHYLPQGEFPCFIVNPKNLTPSCTQCNGKKNDIWRVDGDRVFLNFYKDNLPSEQYLFVNTHIEEELIEVDFFLENRHGIAADIYNLIQTHYERLDLLNRFRNRSNLVVTSLDNIVKSAIEKLSVEDAMEVIVGKCERDKVVFGNNYWQTILELTLANDPDYINKFRQEE